MKVPSLRGTPEDSPRSWRNMLITASDDLVTTLPADSFEPQPPVLKQTQGQNYLDTIRIVSSNGWPTPWV